MSIYHGQQRVYYVDSFNRINGTDSNFEIKLNLPSNNYNKVALLQLSCPKSFYNFTTGSNTFILKELGVSRLITIPIGNYTKNTLLQNLGSILTSASLNGWVYAVSYPSNTQPNTGLLTFTVTNNTGQPQFQFETSCWLQLGFERNTTYSFSSNSLTSVNCISLSPVNRIYVKSSMCNTSQDSILQEVLQTFPDNSFIYYENINVDINSKEFTGNTSSTFSFLITDRFGIPIDTHGINVMMSILLYEKNNTDEIHKDELLIKNVERMLTLDTEKQSILRDTEPANISTDASVSFIHSTGVINPRGIGSFLEIKSNTDETDEEGKNKNKIS
jgi:hypothetical protein